ncbi:MAG: hypothetical protein H6607_04105 [Flavobacteriales bacterium]|nr:hypothetical protein [Flavobacteriales bacterium]
MKKIFLTIPCLIFLISNSIVANSKVDKCPNRLNKKGEKKGTWVTLDPSTNAKTIEHFRNGKHFGKYLQFSNSGNLLKKGRYWNDKKYGRWVTYTVMGSKVASAFFIRNKCITYTYVNFDWEIKNML